MKISSLYPNLGWHCEPVQHSDMKKHEFQFSVGKECLVELYVHNIYKKFKRLCWVAYLQMWLFICMWTSIFNP